MRQVWAPTFSVPPGDTSAILYNLSQLLMCVSEARSQIARIGSIRVKDPFLDSLSELDAVFARYLSLDLKAAQFATALTPQIMTGLYCTAARLSECNGDFDVEALVELTSEVVELQEQVAASTLPKELKLAVIRALERIHRAILEFRIRGVDGLQEAVDVAVGRVARYAKEVDLNSVTEGDKTLLKRFIGVIESVDSIASTCLKIPQLVKLGASSLLGLPNLDE